MKEKINKLLNKHWGLQIVRTHNNFYSQKYRQLIKETALLYESKLGLQIGPLDEQREFLLSQLQGTSIGEALYLLNYLNKSMKADGDICEFGIAQGSTSALMANEIRKTGKNIWLFDSFEGLPKPTEKDILKDDIYNLGSMDAYTGKMACGVDMVKVRLKQIDFPFDKVKIIPGFIEETIKFPNLPSKVCFAYIDFDFYEPILIALNFLDKVIQKGGCLMVDDYDWFSTGAKTAADEFFAQNKDKYDFILPDKSSGHFCMLVRK